MKLHLPKSLLTAVVTAVCSAWSLTQGADIISVNFTHSDTNNIYNISVTETNKDETLGGVSTGQWQNVNPSANTQFTVDVTNQSGTKVGTLLVDNIQGTWHNGNGGSLTGEIQKGYIDVYNHTSRIYTIGVDHDYWFTDVVIYMGGDTAGDNKYSPMVVNGTTYVGGANVVKTDSNVTNGGWGTANIVKEGNTVISRYADFSEKNSITVTGVTGDLTIQNTYPNGDARGTVAAIQVIDRTAETVYFTTLGEGTTNATEAQWALNGVETAYGDISAEKKYLGVYAAEAGSTLNLAEGDDLVFLGVGSNELTVTAGGVVSIDNLHTHTEDSILNLNATLTANQNLKITGEGLVNINTDQSLGTLTNSGALHIGDNVTIVLSGSFVNSGTLTAGTGAALFTSVAAGTAVSIGNSTITAKQEILIDHLQDGNIMLNAAETNMEVSTTGGTLAFAKGTEAPGDIVVNISTLTHSAGELTMAAGKGVSVVAGDYVLQGNNNLTISGAGVVTLGSITTTGDNIATTLTVDAGATLKATSMVASWGRNLMVNGELEFTGAVGLSLKSNGSPIISGTGTIKTEKLTVGNHGHYSVEVNRMEIGSGGITVEDANGYSLNMGATTIAATESWTNAVTTGFTLSDNSTGTTFEVAENAAIELKGVISNKEGATGMLVKTGEGKLTLSGANTYTGGTKINAGQVVAGNDDAFGTGMLHLIGGSVEILEDRTIATEFDMGGQGNGYAGKLNVAAGKHLTMTHANLWLGPNASINLAAEAKLTKGDMTIIGTGADSSITRHADKQGNGFSAGSSSHIVSNAKVEVASGSESTLALQLDNSSVTNAGEGKLIVNNAANTLTAVNAEKGNITVQNASASKVTIGAISAASGKKVTTEIADLEVGTVSLKGGLADGEYSLSTTGSLTIGTLELDLTAYSDMTKVYNLVSTTGADATITLTNPFTGTVDGYTYTVNGSGTSSLTLSFEEIVAPSTSLTTTVLGASLNGTMLTLTVDGDITAYTETANITGFADGVLADILNLTKGVADGMVRITLVDGDEIQDDTILGNGYSNVGFYGAYYGEGTSMYFVQYIPEPATATLSLLALAGLAARRRRK